ncbi:putative SnoaL-like aldol condensation-catalyzing enzyme [Chitinophaga niastensis]|uniref:Putative SnoaL-like aldol condensation-catalyzing enzyme n=1 Tax=Chitinophaga niastensis TaxID=536980 RepID=A0A2P8H9E7_CHINA|nr:nuclear transport factor 2 family protein [Chitinophaga niastensis]PSL42857.1 putative SnoaL-like aldol condensation-catalyzing enzyme [Chitinophaga niastensis]
MIQTSNKAIVLAALKHLIGQLDSSYIDTYVSDRYIQHSPTVPDGKAGLLQVLHYLKQMPQPAERKSPVVRVIADGDFVMLHMDLVFMGSRRAVIDLYRLEEGRLAEHWDASQEQREQAAGDSTMTNGTVDITDLALTEENKSIVSRFFLEPTAVLLSADYTEHDPFIGWLDTYLAAQVNRTVHRVIGEGNFVLVQSAGEEGPFPFVFYDICRIENKQIAEHWRVMQAIPDVMSHENGML